MTGPRRSTSDPMSHQMDRETAGANPVPPAITNPTMATRVVQNAIKCCYGPPKDPPEVVIKDECPGPVPFQNPLAGECDIDFKFRADVDLVEKFIPRNTPSYPPMTTPPSGEEADGDPDAFLLDKASGLIQPVEYTKCFDSWRRGGYQRDR